MKLNFLILFSLIFFFSCNPHREAKLIKFTGEAQGTYYAVTYYDELGINFKSEIDSLLEIFDQSVSIWVPNSIISKINRNDSSVNPDYYFTEIFNLSKEVYDKSDGAFDPTVGPLVNAWGFGFTDRMKVDKNIIDSLLPLVGFSKVKLSDNKIIKEKHGIQFDFNAIAQGYSVDLSGKLLEERGITSYLIDIGGEVLGKGKKPNGDFWKVGIEKPKDNASYGEDLQAIVELNNKALATSGNYRKFYEENGIRYSHTIDPETGYPVQHSLLSVSVLANNCGLADAWATTFMVMGLEKSKDLLKNETDIEACFIYSDEEGNIKTFFSKGFEMILEEGF